METLQKFSIPLSIIIAGALIAGGVMFGFKPASRAPAGGDAAVQPNVDVNDIKITASDPIIGNPKAPLTLVYWFDYQCPFCKQFDQTSLQTLIKSYVDSGRLKIVLKDFAFLGEDSTVAAEYGHAVWEMYPDKYRKWHEAMFKAQDQEGDQGFGDEPSILKLTGTIPGMDAGKLKALVAQKKKEYDAVASANQQEAVKYGIQGTPGSVTGKQVISGAQPAEVFTAAIEAQLK